MRPFKPLLLGAVLLVGLLPRAPALAQSGSPGLLLEADNGLPSTFVACSLSDPEGLGPRVEVYGVSWEGRETLAYEEDLPGWATELRFPVYRDPSWARLEVRLKGGRRAAFDLEAALSPGLGSDLGAPIVDPPEGPLPLDLHPEAAMPLALARDLLSRIPRGPLPLASLGVLLAYALAASLLAALGRRRTLPKVLGPGLALVAALMAAILLPREARLVLVEMPPPDARGFVGGTFSRLASEPTQPALVRFAHAEAEGNLACFFLATPGDSQVPLEALDAGGKDTFEFSSPILVVRRQGQIGLRARGLVTGWRHHGTH